MAGQALNYGLNKLGEKGIYYGYVEAENIHSLKPIQKIGRISLGQYHSVVISRLNPKDTPRVEKLEGVKRDQLVHLLYDQYENYSLTDFELGVKADNYYVLTQGGDIIASLQIKITILP